MDTTQAPAIVTQVPPPPPPPATVAQVPPVPPPPATVESLRAALQPGMPLHVLSHFPRFLLYRMEWAADKGKFNKVPVNPWTVQPANAHDAANHLPWDQACITADIWAAGYGVGFDVNAADCVAVLDIDRCIIDGKFTAIANTLLAMFPGAAVERSLSGTGLHIIFRYQGTPPAHAKKNAVLNIELFTSGQFVALTGIDAQGDAATDHTEALARAIADYFPQKTKDGNGAQWTESLVPVADDDALIAKACAAAPPGYGFGNAATFAELMEGNAATIAAKFTAGASEADWALASTLCFWTSRDPARIERIMLRSGLKREKWEEHRDGTTWLRYTILRAIDDQSEKGKPVYTGTVPGRVPSPPPPPPGVVAQVPQTGLTPIAVDKGMQAYVVDAMQSVLAGTGNVYQREQKIVRTARAVDMHASAEDADTVTDSHGVKRDKRQIVIQPMQAAAVRLMLARHATFFRSGKTGPITEDVPKDRVDELLASKDWPLLPPLNGIVTAPTLRADGTILQGASRYDPASGVIFDTPIEFPPIPENPTHADALAALAVLLEPFEEFPFADDLARAALLTAILTRLTRTAYPKRPIFASTAPDAGSGKGLMVDCVEIIASGNIAPKRPFSSDADEFRKSFTGALIVGDATYVIDNAPRGALFGANGIGAELQKTATEGIRADRLLGGNTEIRLPNDIVIWVTGNALRFGGDTIRRIIEVRLVPGVERAHSRTFRRAEDLASYVARVRPQLVTAALTILRGYIAAGRPRVGPANRLGSFEQWDDLVRRTVIWATGLDPVDTQNAHFDLDDSDDSVADAFAPLLTVFGQGADFSAGYVLKKMPAFSEFMPATDATQAAQVDLARIFTTAKGERMSAKAIGAWLRANRDRVHDGVKLWARFNSDRKQLAYWFAPPKH